MQDRISILGVGVDRCTWSELVERVADLVRAGGKATVAYANIHVLNTAVGDAELARFLNAADVCYCDGAGVRLGARVLGEHLQERMTGADWIHDLGREAARRGWRLFWLGSEPGVTEKAAGVLMGQNEGLHIDHDHGYHEKTGPQNDALLDRINACAPHIVLVGMGTPVQEAWVAANRARIDAPVVWVLGATADFVSGKVSRGPAVLYNNQEWLARLLTEPRRLWKRYLIGNTVFLGRVMWQRVSGAR